MTASLAYELTELTELRNGTNETNGNQQKTDSFFFLGLQNAHELCSTQSD